MIENEIDKTSWMKRGLSWVELKNSLDIGGCPVCNTMLRSIEKYFEFLLYEYALDATVHKKNLASFGMCNTHTYLLKEIEEKLKSDGLNISVLYETLFQKEERLLKKINEKEYSEENKKFSPFKKKKGFVEYKKEILSELVPRGTCPGCLQQRESESFYTHEILRLYADAEFKSKYENEEIQLCRHHFLYLINEAETDEMIKYFVKVQREKIELLHKQLKNFIQNHDYRLKSEMTEKEIKSWEKALQYFGSMKGIGKDLYHSLIVE